MSLDHIKSQYTRRSLCMVCFLTEAPMVLHVLEEHNMPYICSGLPMSLSENTKVAIYIYVMIQTRIRFVSEI